MALADIKMIGLIINLLRIVTGKPFYEKSDDIVKAKLTDSQRAVCCETLTQDNIYFLDLN